MTNRRIGRPDLALPAGGNAMPFPSSFSVIRHRAIGSDPQTTVSTSGHRQHVVALVAAVVFLSSLTFYVLCLFPGLGGQLNSGDSAKFQVLGHTPIMVHGPGYPLVLMLGTVLRALALPLPEWWTLTVAMAAIPGAWANTIAFLLVHRLTRSVAFGAAAALLLGGAGLMAVQSTEAEVYALNIAFILTTASLLCLFVETRKLSYFLAACAVYAISFGNHLMMIMLVPVFLWITIANYRMILRPLPIALVALFVLVGASQYLFVAYTAYSPNTAYSEYMPLPPTVPELIEYILGTYFSELYGSGLSTINSLTALVNTVRSAHPWISLPLILAGALLFAAGWRRRDSAWLGLAILFGTALCFSGFALWYGAYDIEAFHLPVVGSSIVAATATLGWWLRGHRRLQTIVAALLITVGLARAGQTFVLLHEREPIFDGMKEAIEAMIAQSPVERPIFAMSYGVRMATLYHTLRGDLPDDPIYRVHWRAIGEIKDQDSVGGVVVPADGYQFIRWIQHHRSDLDCRTEKLDLPDENRWPAYAFECHSTTREPR